MYVLLIYLTTLRDKLSDKTLLKPSVKVTGTNIY